MTKNQYAHQRGKINDSAVKALVTDPFSHASGTQ